MALTGCSSIPPATTENATAASSSAHFQNYHVVESLVADAASRRSHILVRPPLLLATPESEEVTEIVPITTTVPMTPNRVVERALNDFLQNRRAMLQSWVGRSRIYFPMIEQIFAEEGVPDELKYLALTESGLNPTAGSWAGAVGMWQFMAQTARSEGLRVDAWVDERRDPEKSTRAAARHLLALNESYNNRWHLSLAGYNCSYRCISRAVEHSGHSIDEPPSFWDVYSYLPQETRNFVPKFIAAALIVSNPEQFGIEVPDLGQTLSYDLVYVQGMLSLKEAARLAGTDLATMRNLNPALLKNTLPNDAEPYALKIPPGSHDKFLANLTKQAPASGSSNGPSGNYVVRSGDTLGRIARAHETTVAELQAANGISGHLIKIGQTLALPGSASTHISLASSKRHAVSYASTPFRPIKLADEFQLVHQSGSTPEKPLLAVSLNLNAVESDEGAMSLVPTIYKVQPGDTLGRIAQQYGVSVASIQSGNNLRGTTIFPSQELTIHSATNIVDPPQPGTLLYQVQHGDSLYEIARRHSMSVNQLKRLNGLRNDLIHPGQNLQVN